ncbi:MAG TPA: hypothetical protein VED40_16865 [Azospirillaceae bacterium]|nr:hypothetical protein [Azospirillaceae bacterium]
MIEMTVFTVLALLVLGFVVNLAVMGSAVLMGLIGALRGDDGRAARGTVTGRLA